MAEALIDDFEDLLTCSVCLENFDNEVRKPKFLSCHHTLCLECVKSMSTQMLVTCPLCRKETHFGDNKYGLPNNNYVLQMIASQSRTMIKSAPSQQFSSDTSLVKKRWCLKCRKDALDSCSSLSGHDAILASSSEFCLEMLKSKDKNETQMATIIEERREAKNYLTRILDSLKIVEDEIKQLEEDNDDHLVKMISLLEDAGTIVSAEHETAESFSEKVNQCTEMIKQELGDVKRFKDSYLDHMKNTTIFVQFKDQEGDELPYGFSLFDTGFSPVGRAGQQIQPKKLEVASHILLSLLKSNGNSINKSSSQAVLHQPIRSAPRTEQHKASYNKELDFIFSFNCFNSNDSLLGSVFIKPDNRFYQPFIAALSHLCTEPVKKIPAKFIMGLASQHVIIEFGCSSSGFQLAVPKIEELMTVQPFDRKREEQSLDVRLIDIFCQGNTITSFKLGFMFDSSHKTTRITREMHPLLGKIVKGKWVLERMIDFDRMREFTQVRIGKYKQELVPLNDSVAVKPKNTNNTFSTALDPSLLIRVDPNQIQNLQIQNGDLFISLNQPRSQHHLTRSTQNAIKPMTSPGRSGQPMQEIIITRNSVFAMTFTRRNRNMGTILLKPDKNFYRPFIEGLARFCQSPILFSGQIEKAHPTFVTFEFSHTNFRQKVPNPRNFMNDSSHCDVENALEVGFFDYNYEGRSVTDFQLMFLLEPYNPDHMKECTRFGKVVSGNEILEQFSQKRMNERDNFTISIEFRKL